MVGASILNIHSGVAVILIVFGETWVFGAGLGSGLKPTLTMEQGITHNSGIRITPHASPWSSGAVVERGSNTSRVMATATASTSGYGTFNF